MQLLCVSHKAKVLYVAVGDNLVQLAINSESGTAVELNCSKSCIKRDNENEFAGDSVMAITADETGEFLYVALANKQLSCWRVSDSSVVSTTILRKRPTALFSASFALQLSEEPSLRHNVVVAADKAGDVYAADTPLLHKQVLLAGHTASVITDMDFHSKYQLVATADRDEKIRISLFPGMESVQAYCLGHTSVVSSICFLNTTTESTEISSLRPVAKGDVFLLSTGWDHQLCMWDAFDGQLMCAYKHETANSGAPLIESSAAVATADRTSAGNISSNLEKVNSKATTEDAVAVVDVEEEPEEKTYDESSAGQYPFKIVVCNDASTSLHSQLIAVMYKDLSDIKIFSVRSTADGGYFFSLDLTLTASAVPSDIIFINATTLVVLLPGALGVQVFSLKKEGSDSTGTVPTVLLQEVTDSPLQRQLMDYIRGGDARRVIPQGGIQTGHNEGMMKHRVDKRFDVESSIDYTARKGARKGARRSTKRSREG